MEFFFAGMTSHHSKLREARVEVDSSGDKGVKEGFPPGRGCFKGTLQVWWRRYSPNPK
jgi:hypothetical protein